MAFIQYGKNDWTTKEDEFNTREVIEIPEIKKEDFKKVDNLVVIWPFIIH